MKAELFIEGSEQIVCIAIRPETDFERTLIDRLSNYLPFTQPCCLEKHLLIETKMKDNLFRENK